MPSVPVYTVSGLVYKSTISLLQDPLIYSFKNSLPYGASFNVISDQSSLSCEADDLLVIFVNCCGMYIVM